MSSYVAHLIAPKNWAQDNKKECSWDGDPISSLRPNLWLCWVQIVGPKHSILGPWAIRPRPSWKPGLSSMLTTDISGCRTFSYVFEIMAYLLCSILIWKISTWENHSPCKFDALSLHQLLILLFMWRYCWALHNGRGTIYAFLNFSTTQYKQFRLAYTNTPCFVMKTSYLEKIMLT